MLATSSHSLAQPLREFGDVDTEEAFSHAISSDVYRALATSLVAQHMPRPGFSLQAFGSAPTPCLYEANLFSRERAKLVCGATRNQLHQVELRLRHPVTA